MKAIKVLLVIFTLGLFSSNVFASNFDKIEAVNNNTIQITASSDVVFSDAKVEWEIKLLKDVAVWFSTKDTQDFKKVMLNLTNDLMSNTSYSLISILWAEWNIDFKIWDFLTWSIDNPNLVEWEKWIKSVRIIDSRTIELNFNYDIQENTFEFKILSEIPTNGLKSSWNNMLTLDVASNLEKSANYIIMVLNLKDISWSNVKLDEDLYDFTTPSDLVQQVVEQPVTIAQVEPVPVVTNTWNIVEVAKKVEKTPDTWAATNILFMIAFMLSFWLFYRKRFSKQ